MNNPFDYIPDPMCEEAYRSLLASPLFHGESPSFLREVEKGKMFGVLIARDSKGDTHTLAAFSGQIADSFHWPGFVPPVFDYLDEDGYFKREEKRISAMKGEIASLERELLEARERLASEKGRLDPEIEACRRTMQEGKRRREARRAEGSCTPEDLEAMILESQFEKGELARCKKRCRALLRPFLEEAEECERRLEELKRRRQEQSEELQRWLFDNSTVLNGKGESATLTSLFAHATGTLPPSGAGECCAPKLLHHAFHRGWNPIAMAEYWYGKSPSGEVRHHGASYPACRGKCLPILPWMLRGVEIDAPLPAAETPETEVIFENRYFCVVNKPPGLLSVPGKGPAPSVQSQMETRYPDRDVHMVHRLDQATSGLMLVAFGELARKVLQGMFACRKIHKTYRALLDGDYREAGLPEKGTVSLPLIPDFLDRPRQKVDFETGKEAVTDYEFEGVDNEGRSIVTFRPRTGRTHQLRVHASSPLGLGLPIAGDPLYHGEKPKTAQRLMLHAERLEFDFPVTKEHFCFEIPAYWS